MHGFWKQIGLDTALGRFMAAVDNPEQPHGPPDVSAAIRLAHDVVLQRRLPMADIADRAWQLGAHCHDRSTHDLALVTALYFLADKEQLPSRLDYLRFEARILAQHWLTEGFASVAVVARFEEALFRES